MGRQYVQLYKEFISNVGKHKVGTVIPEEFATLFNLALEEVYTNKLSGMEVNKKITDDLNIFNDSIKNVNMTLDASDLYRCFTVSRPSACKRIKKITVVLDSKYNARCVQIKAQNKEIILSSVLDRPTVKKCYYELTMNGTIEIIRVYVPIITNTVKAYVDFYKEQTLVTETDVTSTNVLPYSNEMCTEIINVASRMCIERNQDGRYQTFGNELKQKQINQ